MVCFQSCVYGLAGESVMGGSRLRPEVQISLLHKLGFFGGFIHMHLTVLNIELSFAILAF
jgi:hypothetical protein